MNADTLENRILNLEFEQLKRRTRKALSQAKPKERASSSQEEILFHSELVNGKWIYRTADGVPLPESRGLWPAEIRRIVELEEAVDTARMRSSKTGGRMLVSAPCFSDFTVR